MILACVLLGCFKSSNPIMNVHDVYTDLDYDIANLQDY